MAAIGIVIVIAALILFFAGLGQFARNAVFSDAQVVTGTVIYKRKRHLKNGTACELTITYKVNGIEYSTVVGVTISEYSSINEGNCFNLKYRPDKPHKAINPDALDPAKVRSVLICSTVMASVGSALLIVGLLL